MWKATHYRPRSGFAVDMPAWNILYCTNLRQKDGQVAQGKEIDEFVSAVLNTMRFTVVVDWSVYPLGYFFGSLMAQWMQRPQFDLQLGRHAQQHLVCYCNFWWCRSH